MLRTALLVLLAEGRSHGYDLLSHVADLGIETEPGALYRTLRSMDRHQEVRSCWDSSPHGPARRVYTLTPKGDRLLAEALDRLRAQGAVIDGLLNRCTSRRSTGASSLAPDLTGGSS